MKLDILIDCSYGDTGKGKVCGILVNKNNYDFCARGQGGQNAGHQVWVNDTTKVTTNIVPSGALFGTKSFIGSECYINERAFLEELDRLSKVRPDVSKLIKISHEAHIVTDEHLKEEEGEARIGSTRRGIGPCARDKYSRIGKRVEDSAILRDYAVDLYDELYIKNPNANVLFEGAQGFYLDISHGDYPYVTSSHCSVGGILNNGFNHTQVRNVFGVIKGYTTYVGSKSFQDPGDKMLDKIIDVGMEFGSVTGRRRQANYLNINELQKAIHINGVNYLYVNKMDILREVKCWKVIRDNVIVDLGSESNFKSYIEKLFPSVVTEYSYSPLSV